jgi:hypothetical protein
MGANLGASLIAEAVHCAMLAIIVASAEVVANLDEVPKSLVELARRLGQLDAHSFEPYEYEVIALLDRVHLSGSDKVLLPESFCLDVLQGGHGFAERLVRIARTQTRQTGDDR